MDADGSVSSATVKNSSFDNPDFELALIDALRAAHFVANPLYLPDSFSYRFRASGLQPPPSYRPLTDIQQQADVNLVRYNVVFKRYYPGHAAPKGARLQVSYTVQPDGRVSDASITSSSYGNAEFEKALVDTVLATRFEPRPRTQPTRFTLQFGDPASSKPAGEKTGR